MTLNEVVVIRVRIQWRSTAGGQLNQLKCHIWYQIKVF